MYEEILKDHTKLTPHTYAESRGKVPNRLKRRRMFVFELFLTMSRTIALILFTVALPALGAEIAVNVRDADFVRNGYAEIDLRLKDVAPEGAVTRLGI